MQAARNMNHNRQDCRADASLPAVRRGFVAQLVVRWWAKDARGLWKQVQHAPLELEFEDAAELHGALEKYARTQEWQAVQLNRKDLALGVWLQSTDVEADKAREAKAKFLNQAQKALRVLRTAGRSRCEVVLSLRAGSC
jgi:hypothetical protein